VIPLFIFDYDCLSGSFPFFQMTPFLVITAVPSHVFYNFFVATKDSLIKALYYVTLKRDLKRVLQFN
jgi:uncharacterized membrane-anchored protein YitT (DUF2179 family)